MSSSETAHTKATTEATFAKVMTEWTPARINAVLRARVDRICGFYDFDEGEDTDDWSDDEELQPPMPKEAVLVEHGKPALPVHWTLCPSSEDHEAENDAMKAAVMLATARTEQVLAHMDAVLRSVDIDALCNSVASTELTD